MSFSSDSSSNSNQVIGTFNLPNVKEGDLFEDRLESFIRYMRSVINTKEGGLYNAVEVLAFKQIFTTGNPQKFRNVYRKTFDLVDLNGGNIAGGATVVSAHNIDDLADSIFVYASCVTTDPEYFTVVYPDVHLDATNINFTNPHGSAITKAYAICEYTKE